MLKDCIEDYILKNGKRTCLFFILVAVAFFIDKLTLGPLAAVQLHDLFETDFPRYKPMGELLFRHGPYFWYPNWPGGAPAYAWHHSPFYILNIAAQFMPLWAVYGVLLIALMSVAGYGMYRFLSEYLSVAGWVSVVGGVYFALSMQLTSLFILYTFSYAFPLYFALSWEFGNSHGNRKDVALSLIILNLIVALSYPVLTLPYFFILEVLLIVLLHPEGENTRLRMLIKTSIVWFGYILVCLPVLYGLYKYVPFSHRTYVYEAPSLVEFLKSIYTGFTGFALTVMALIPLAGAIAISGKSARVRRSLIVLCIVVFLYAVFSSGLNVIFRGTLFEKMDLGHITTVFPIVIVMAVFVAIDTVIRGQKLLRRFLIGELIGAAFAAFAIFITKTIDTQGIQYLILNIGSGVFISLMVITAGDKDRVFSFPKLAKNPAVTLVFSCVAVAAIFYFGPKKLAMADLISIAPILIITIWAFFLFCEKLHTTPNAAVLKLNWILIAAIAVVLFFQVRFTRFFGEESVPYISIFPNIDVLETIKQENNYNPFRVASLDHTAIPWVQSHGFETPDGRGPLFNKYYREFFKVVINPQLSDKGFLPYFESNWYNLFISNFTSNTLFSPYCFLNIRYIVARGVSSNAPAGVLDLVYTGSSIGEHSGISGKLMKYYSKPIAVVRLNTAFDRFYLVKNISTHASDKAVYDTLVATEGVYLLNTVYLSGTDIHSSLTVDGEQFKKNKITLDSYAPDEIRLNLELATPAAIVASNNYAPNWRAYVNGVETKVHRANIAFQSVIIENPGQYSVVLRYEDKILRLLHIFIPLGIVVYSWAVMIRRRNP